MSNKNYIRLWLASLSLLVSGACLYSIRGLLPDITVKIGIALIACCVCYLAYLAHKLWTKFCANHIELQKKQEELEQQRQTRRIEGERWEMEMLSARAHVHVLLSRVPLDPNGNAPILIRPEIGALPGREDFLLLPPGQLRGVKAREYEQIGPPSQETTALPGRYDLRTVWRSFTPSRDQIFLGRSAMGDIIVPANKLLHCALTGPTGGGKTSILRMLLMQLIYIGAQVTLCDIHYAPIKMSETGEPIDWRPIERRLAQPPIRSIDVIAEWIQALAFVELQNRIERQYAGRPIGDPVFFTIEELPAVLDEAGAEVGRPLAKILRQGRQYGIYFLGASQDLLTNTLKMTTGPRECFRTGYYTGGDPTTARALLDLKQGEKVDENGLGQDGLVYLKTAIHPAIQTRVGWASNDALYDLFQVPARERLGTTVQAEDEEMEELQYRDVSQSFRSAPYTPRERDFRPGSDFHTGPLQRDFEGEKETEGEVSVFSKNGLNGRVDGSDLQSEEGLKYRFSENEIVQFIAAYKVAGNIEKVLSSMKKGSGYKQHARELIHAHRLRNV